MNYLSSTRKASSIKLLCPFNKNRGFAFTLAEVLIVLGIIGVLANMTIPTLIKDTQNAQYKTMYKQAYSDMSQAFAQAISEQSLTPRTADDDAIATASEWAVMKAAFKVTKNCPSPNNLDKCWPPGEKIGGQPDYTESSFIDNSGRIWAEYYYLANVYFVDTNGFKGPNKFGKDRWFFTLAQQADPRVTVGLPDKVAITITGGSPDSMDQSSANGICSYPPCYYYSWLYN